MQETHFDIPLLSNQQCLISVCLLGGFLYPLARVGFFDLAVVVGTGIAGEEFDVLRRRICRNFVHKLCLIIVIIQIGTCNTTALHNYV